MAEVDPPEAVQLELFTNRFAAVVRDMGSLLSRTALSTNVKERLDFSCALLDREGQLVVNAPHIPVHLGAVGLCVRRLLDERPMADGDTVVTNHPAFGGSHLPDVTLVTPVFDADGDRVAFVANRAHHAEIGGRWPGSVPPDATRLSEEGVVIPPLELVRRGETRWPEVRRLLEGGRYPSRAPAENLADLAAGLAANRLGAGGLKELVREHGAGTVRRYMDELRESAARRMGEALRRLGDGVFAAREELDDGTPLAVRIEVESGRASVDFAGSGPVHSGNLNATPAVVRSVVLYVLRLLVAEELPLNEGLLAPVRLSIPSGILAPPFAPDPEGCPAVVGGNVETSQRLVDLLLKALGLVACSQGTMNNVIFGDGRFGYYETLGGGCGAGPGFAGASAVHSHMTNTRMTDPEILEHRYPVRVRRLAVRRGSGGAGRWRGGDGLVRELEFLAPVHVSVLTQHRSSGPYGVEGGAAGAPGRQRLQRSTGEVVKLASVDGVRAEPGDRLEIETPGGGGWGAPEETG